MLNGAATIGRGAVLANMLNAPIPELTMGDDIDAGQYLFDARALLMLVKFNEERHNG